MLNPAAIDDVLRLIELRSRFDDCQRLLMEEQAENRVLRTNNADLRKQLSQADAKNTVRMGGTYAYPARSHEGSLCDARFTTTFDLAVVDDAGK